MTQPSQVKARERQAHRNVHEREAIDPRPRRAELPATSIIHTLGSVASSL